MRWRLLSKEASEEIFILVLDPGEEAFAAISEFAATQKISAASLIAIGAFEKAVVGWYDLEKRDYRRIVVDEQSEVLSLIGDIALGEDGKRSLHAHVVLGLSDGTTRGGHFLEGTVKPTLEVTLSETPAHLRRKHHPDLGIALIDV
ncbi:DNA-binding protein [Sinorhizobium sp. 8-89]|uniref:PPC domain-containing DNA-binding protein n=1 Tax=Sinorhizobium sp. 7-81 TaxID=3049087 RepID=UPI0024C2DA87|nr:DNA-binding protein [Sinorhizobium sp. 7-81]MDK1385345.1 DNA-binding protein [Sinorhizobium sp. 7-81]